MLWAEVFPRHIPSAGFVELCQRRKEDLKPEVGAEVSVWRQLARQEKSMDVTVWKVLPRRELQIWLAGTSVPF